MLKKEEWIGLGTFLLFFTTFLYFNTPSLEAITGFAVSDPTFSIELLNTKISANDTLKGSLNVTFNGSADSTTLVQATFGDVRTDFTLTQLLNLMNLNYTETKAELRASNSEDTKKLIFPSEGSQKIAFKLPLAGIITKFELRLEGDPDKPLSFVGFDVPDLTEKEEWRYFGDFIKYTGSPILPEDLDPSTEDGIWFIEDNETYYCEQIELPYSKHYQVSVRARKRFPGANSLWATILSFDGEYASGGGERCEMPSLVAGDPLKWNSCGISFENGQIGTYLACVYMQGDCEGSTECYEIARDSTVSKSRFTCPIGETEMSCTSYMSKDFFIKADYGVYTKKLNKTVLWEDGATAQDITQSITEYLEDCTEDEVGDCSVPVTITSESGGEVTLASPRVFYTTDGASSVSTKIYDLVEVPGSITKIDGANLENATKTVAIDLKHFNLTAPPIAGDSETFFLNIRFVPGESFSEPVKVYKAGLIPTTDDVEELIRSAKEIFKQMSEDYSDLVILFNIDVNTRQLDTYEIQLASIKNSDKSLAEKEAEMEELTNVVKEYLATKPASFSIAGQFRDMYIPVPEDVEEVTVENQKAAYLFQNKVGVNVEVTNYVLTWQSGEISEYSVIEKTITPSKILKEVYVYEIIPKSAANDVTGIIFKDIDYEVVEKDPIIRYAYPSLSGSKKIVYGVRNALTPNMVSELKTIVIPQNPEEIVEREYECGDGVCTKPYEDELICPQDCGGSKIPWTLIIILVVLLIGGVVYINFYKGKGEFRKLVGRSPFKTPQDLENIKKYIKSALDKGSKKQAIAKSLLSSGWTKKQIVYAFEDLKWDEKRAFTTNLAPGSKENIKKLKTFIKKCLQLNISEEKIRSTLVQKGWTSKQVEQAFAEIGKPQEKRPETLQEEEKRQTYYFEKMGEFQEK